MFPVIIQTSFITQMLPTRLYVCHICQQHLHRLQWLRWCHYGYTTANRYYVELYHHAIWTSCSTSRVVYFSDSECLNAHCQCQ